MVRQTLTRFSGAFVASMRDLADVNASATAAYLLLTERGTQHPTSLIASTSKAQVLFVGSLWYEPNVQGVEWLLKSVWPFVQRSIPQATLLLVGAAPESVRQRWSNIPGVRAPGFVDDLSDAYAQSAVAVVPIQMGGGTNIKVLEALSYACPCVVSTLVAGAFEPHLRKDEHFRVAEDPDDFARQISDVLRGGDSEMDLRQAENGRLVVAENFSPKIFESAVQNFARNTLEKT